MFFFIFCSFGANNNNTSNSKLTPYFKLTPYSTLPSYIILHIIHQARDDATSPTHTTNGTRHPTSTVWRHSLRDGWRRGVARRDSRQNTRADRCGGSVSACLAERPRESRCSTSAPSSSAWFRSKERQGGGEGQRVRAIGGEIERARKRAGKKRSERAQAVANEEESEARS